MPKHYIDAARLTTWSNNDLIKRLPHTRMSVDQMGELVRQATIEHGYGLNKSEAVANGFFDILKVSRLDALVAICQHAPFAMMEQFNYGLINGWARGKHWNTVLSGEERMDIARVAWTILQTHRNEDPRWLEFRKHHRGYYSQIDTIIELYGAEMASTFEPRHEGIINCLKLEDIKYSSILPFLTSLDKKVQLERISQQASRPQENNHFTPKL